MDIGICGFGYSGSGAVIDLLKEYGDVNVADGTELFLTYFPDGLIDLHHHVCEYHARFFNGDVAVKRFLSLCRRYGNLYGWSRKKKRAFLEMSEKFVRGIVTCRYNGYWAYDLSQMNEFHKTWYFRIGSRVNRLLKREAITPKRPICFSYGTPQFAEQAKAYMDQVKAFLGFPSVGKNVINQPFAADSPEASFPFFEDPRAILVTRDPRDVYIMIKHFIKGGASWVPYEDVEKFIVFYKAQMQSAYSRERVLTVRFEDLIYRYEETKGEIAAFLGLENHNKKGTFFRPEHSVSNTRLYEKYPEYRADVMRIEEELGEYLYPYENFPKIEDIVKPFWD